MSETPITGKAMSKMRCNVLSHEQGNEEDLITVVAASGVKLAGTMNKGVEASIKIKHYAKKNL